MSDILKRADVSKAIASLHGVNIRPLEPERFNATVWVPKKYFTEWRNPQEALLAFLEDDEWERAMLETDDVIEVSIQ